MGSGKIGMLNVLIAAWVGQVGHLCAIYYQQPGCHRLLTIAPAFAGLILRMLSFFPAMTASCKTADAVSLRFSLFGALAVRYA
jgi:hypothetical protein